VAQWDTEELDVIVGQIGEGTELPANLDEASFSPPVHIKTWFYTGVSVRKKCLLHCVNGQGDMTNGFQFWIQMREQG
jgi:hypothetical protein